MWYGFLLGWVELTNTPQWCFGQNICIASGLEGELDPGRYYVQGSHYCRACVPETDTSYSGVFVMP